MENVVPFPQPDEPFDREAGYPGEPVITQEEYIELSEFLLAAVRDAGIQNVLGSLVEVAFHRALEFQAEGDRRGYLRHTRASSQVSQALRFLIHDYSEVDRIVTEEEANPQTFAQKIAADVAEPITTRMSRASQRSDQGATGVEV